MLKMNSRFKSRGKLKADNFPHKKGEWVFGYFVILEDGDREIPHIYGFGEIIPKTAGRYTGENDQSNEQIFENDICKFLYENELYIGIVKYDFSSFVLQSVKTNEIFPLWEIARDADYTEIEVIGNIHDNPELLTENAKEEN